MDKRSYESTYRRSEFSIAALFVLLLALGGGAFAIIRYSGGGDFMMKLLLALVCAFLVALLVVALIGFRVHRWTIEQDDLHIDERPKFPMFGMRRTARLPFAGIVALRRLQSGFDVQLEIATRDGRVFRIAQGVRAGDGPGVSVPDTAGLEEFAAALRAVTASHGVAATEGLSFWNRPFGILLLAAMLLSSIALAALVAYAYWDGAFSRPRAGEFAVAAMMLPVAAAFLLYRSLKRRRAVLSARPATHEPA